MTMIWKLPDLLKRESITAYRLHKAMEQHKISPTTVYRWAKEMPQSIDVAVLERILATLRDLTGKPVNVQDLLEYER